MTLSEEQLELVRTKALAVFPKPSGANHIDFAMEARQRYVSNAVDVLSDGALMAAIFPELEKRDR